MSAPLRVLVVEDSEDDAFLIIRTLQKAGYIITHQRVETATSMATALAEHSWDVVIADYSLPNFSAMAALTLLQHHQLDLPFIIVSGSIGEETAVNIMKAGAHDYVMKENFTRLVPVVERELREAQERQQRRRAEQLIRENEERFRALIENALDMITVLNRAGVISYSSPSTRRVLGYAPEALMHQTLFTYVHPDDLTCVRNAIEQSLHHPHINLLIEFRVQHQSGEWRILEAIGKRLPESFGTDKIVLNSRDITERKQAEIVRKELEAERERRELRAYFFSQMSHELKNPLTSVMMATELLEKIGQTTEAKNKFLQRIRTAVQQMNQLLNDTLIVGKTESGRLEFRPIALDLPEFCANLIDDLQTSVSHQHTIAFTCENIPDPVYMDEQLLRHILSNVLSNALKYSAAGTTVQFLVQVQSFTTLSADLQRQLREKHSPPPNQVITFQIHDAGIGIPLEEQAHLFNPFHRASNVGRIPGTGLGLSIVKDCVDLHGGVLTLTSRVGSGTQVAIILPLEHSSVVETDSFLSC
ncbi:ATP-binding protein [Pantanalinema rosaneae CENA516]|uniref:sensor histidine kinase n=1 Tax=Pantanalinema rosaneae TaxID=1620701 RepID=UPI003D6EE6E5